MTTTKTMLPPWLKKYTGLTSCHGAVMHDAALLRKLEAFFTNPTPETWHVVHDARIGGNGTVRFYEAVCCVNKEYPVRHEPGVTCPDIITARRALQYAAGVLGPQPVLGETWI